MNDKLIIVKKNIVENIKNLSKKLKCSGIEFSEEVNSLEVSDVNSDVLSKLNQVKQRVIEKLELQNQGEKAKKIEEKLAKNVDLNRPVYFQSIGKIHPITKIINLASEIARNMGFELCKGPDIEDEYNNFDALNIPPNHPARQMVDTFYIDDKSEKKLLRTHTSSVQIRHLQASKPPTRTFSIGRVFRKDSDATHTPMFHQMEVLCINNSANLLDLLGTIKKFLSFLLETDKLEYQIRSSYFPFTEPSIEIDIKVNNQWIEVMGAGMVHPNVLLNAKINPNEYQGYAWGLGLDRIAMIKYGIKDLRNMFNSDIEWLEYYGL